MQGGLILHFTTTSNPGSELNECKLSWMNILYFIRVPRFRAAVYFWFVDAVGMGSPKPLPAAGNHGNLIMK